MSAGMVVWHVSLGVQGRVLGVLDGGRLAVVSFSGRRVVMPAAHLAVKS